MKQKLIQGLSSIMCLMIISCNNPKTPDKTMTASDSTHTNAKNELAVRQANDQFYAALNDMFVGKLEPMNAIWSHSKDASFMGPFGGRLLGWDSIGAEFKREAGLKLGGKVVCADLIVHAGADLGYSFCTEVGENMSADGKPVMVSHRATNIFRLENGSWKLIHHHTDISPQLEKAIETSK